MPFIVLFALFWLIGLLTAIEMATFSARRERMVQAVNAGDRRGTLVKAYQRAPADYLAAVQLLATAANFVIGAMIGANIEGPMRRMIDEYLPSFSYRSELSWTLSVGLVTVLAIVLTNILPKHIGFVRANEIALKTARPMRLWIRLTWPITSVIRLASKGLARLLRIAPDEKFRVTERDIDTLLAEGERAGSLDPTEQAVMRRALRLSESTVQEAMVPVEKVLWIEESWTIGKVHDFLRKHGRSNYLVARRSLQRLSGVVRALDVYMKGSLTEAIRPAVFIAPDDSLLVALERLRPLETRVLVVRRGQDVVGLLTLNDVLEQVVGSIRDT